MKYTMIRCDTYFLKGFDSVTGEDIWTSDPIMGVKFGTLGQARRARKYLEGRETVRYFPIDIIEVEFGFDKPKVISKRIYDKDNNEEIYCIIKNGIAVRVKDEEEFNWENIH